MESSSEVEVDAPSAPIDPRESWSLLDLNKELDAIQLSLEKASKRRLPPKEKPFTSLFAEPQYSALRHRLEASTALPDDGTSTASASPSLGDTRGVPDHQSSEGTRDRRGSATRQKLFVPGTHRGRAEVPTSFSPGWVPASRLDSSPRNLVGSPGAPLLDASWRTPERLTEAGTGDRSEAGPRTQEVVGRHGFGTPGEAEGQSPLGTPGAAQSHTRSSWKKSSLAAGAFLTARKSRSRGLGASWDEAEAPRSAPPRVDTQGNAHGTPLALGPSATPGEAVGRAGPGGAYGIPEASKGRLPQEEASPAQAAEAEAAKADAIKAEVAKAKARWQAEEAAKLEARLQALESFRQLAVEEAVRQGREALQLGLLREEVALLEQEEDLEAALGTVHRRLAEEDERQAEAMRALRDTYAETLREVQEQGGGLGGALQEEQEMLRRRQKAEEEAELQRAQALARRKAQEEAEEREREREREKEREREREREREKERVAQAQRAEEHKAAVEAQRQAQAQALKEQEQQQKEKALRDQQAAAKEAEHKAQQEKAQQQSAAPPPKGKLPEWATVKLRDGVELRARGSLRALEQAHAREGQRKEWEAQVAAYRADPARKKERRDVERALVKLVQQISATQQQVAAKSQEITALLQNSGNIPTPFLLLTFSDKVMNQTEACKMPMVAFALAQVLVNVSAKVSGVMDAMLSALSRECPYTVPREWALRAVGAVTEQDKEEHLRFTGYKSDGGKLEITDLFVERIVGCVTLLGAVLQATPAGGGGVFGGGGFGGGGFGAGGGGEQAPRLGMAWQWCAALLNDLPPSRSSATALEAFLKVAGYGMNRKYPRPFQKLLQAVFSQYIPALRELHDPDVSPVVTRLATYVEGSLFLKAPEGLNLPRSDISSNLRA